jgi:hypothetical protein
MPSLPTNDKRSGQFTGFGASVHHYTPFHKILQLCKLPRVEQDHYTSVSQTVSLSAFVCRLSIVDCLVRRQKHQAVDCLQIVSRQLGTKTIALHHRGALHTQVLMHRSVVAVAGYYYYIVNNTPSKYTISVSSKLFVVIFVMQYWVVVFDSLLLICY